MALEGLVSEVKQAIEKATGALKEVAPIDTKIISSTDIEVITQRNITMLSETDTKLQVDEKDTNEYDEDGYRALTDEEAKALQAATNMSDATIKNCTINEQGQIRLKCTNESKVNENKPSEVQYKKQVVDINGYQIEVVMPEFKGVFNITLPPELRCASDAAQFKYCTEQLKKAIEENPDLAKNFTPEQLEQIADGAPRIRDFTWHHCAENGSMQLASSSTHEMYRHTGGKAIWGGGRP